MPAVEPLASPHPLPTGEPDALPDAAAVQRALLFFVASSTGFGVMAFFAKLAAGWGVGGAQVACLRFASGLLPVLLSRRLRQRAFTWQRRDLLFYRGFFGGTAVLLYFLTIDHVPVGLATLLNYTSPVFAGLFAALFIGERVQPRVLPALAAALAGVFLVVRAHGGELGLAAVGPWAVVGLASAALSGAAVTAIRVARRTEGSWAIYTSFNVLGLLATLPFALASWVVPSAKGWLALLGMCAFSMLAQLLMTHAYRWVDNLRAGVVQQLAVFVAMAMGATFLGEPVTVQTIVGSVIAVAGVVAVVAGSRRRVASPEAAADA